MENILSILKDAKDTYAAKSQSKIRKWLVALSARVMHFRTVLDVFVQQHPEYVSLVWGSFKLLFMVSLWASNQLCQSSKDSQVVLNSEQMIKELAKSICRIADALPRAELALLLYPTARMQAAVAQIYKYILRFSHKALSWYKKGSLKHALYAVVKPWELQLEEDVIAIQEQSLIIEAEASAASRAELRDAHIQICKLQSQLNDMTVMITQSELCPAIAKLDTSSNMNQPT